MSRDAGGLAQMTYNNGNNGFASMGYGNAGNGFRRGPAMNSKKLSVALPPTVHPISEGQVDNPTPRTSRSHMLAGLRTQPKTPVGDQLPNGQAQGYGPSQWANASYDPYSSRGQLGTQAFDWAGQYGMNAGNQTYSLPEQVLAPPSLYDETEEMDPSVLQQMQLTSLYLAQRQQQLQQQLANLTASAQGMSINSGAGRGSFMQSSMAPQAAQGMFGQQQNQSPIEVPGQPGVYLVFNPATQAYSYAVDPNVQQQFANQQAQSTSFFQSTTPSVSVTPPAVDRPDYMRTRSWTPPKPSGPQAGNDNVEPLPPPSSNAFRRGHKKVSSLFINPQADDGSNGAKTSSAATFGTQRAVFPAPPMTGTFGPGAGRAGEHPTRQPRGPPPLEELTALPTSKHEGSKNFATRQRRRALDNLVKAGTSRRAISGSRSSAGTPISERELSFSLADDGADDPRDIAGSRKMSPIGTEMKLKRDSRGSEDGGYFGLSSASSSEGEEAAGWKLPPTPASPAVPVAGFGGERKMMMLGLAGIAEKRRSGILT